MTNAQLMPQMDAKTHVLPIRIYYEDTDAGGVVFYANYLRFAERGRTEMMRSVGFESRTMIEERGLVMAVHHVSIDYKRPAFLDDLLTVRTSLRRLGGASVTFAQQVCRDDILLTEIEVRNVCMNMEGKTRRLPDDLRAAFEPFADEVAVIEERE